jgi:hypothetical protein
MVVHDGAVTVRAMLLRRHRCGVDGTATRRCRKSLQRQQHDQQQREFKPSSAKQPH